MIRCECVGSPCNRSAPIYGKLFYDYSAKYHLLRRHQRDLITRQMLFRAHPGFLGCEFCLRCMETIDYWSGRVGTPVESAPEALRSACDEIV